MNVWTLLMLFSGGVFTGGVLTFAWERIPAWRVMPLPQFMTDFAHAIRRADRLQPAMLVVAIVTAIGFGLGAKGAARSFVLVGAAGLMATLIASLAVLVPLQRRIIASPQAQLQAIEAMKRRWVRGHLGRSALAAVSFLLVAAAAAF